MTRAPVHSIIKMSGQRYYVDSVHERDIDFGHNDITRCWVTNLIELDAKGTLGKAKTFWDSDFKGWLKENPQVIALLEDIRARRRHLCFRCDPIKQEGGK
jgi:hypothetical protein